MPDLPKPPPSSEITSEDLYRRRREFIKNGVYALATAAGVGGALTALATRARPAPKVEVADWPEPFPARPEMAGVSNSAQAAQTATPLPSKSKFDTNEPKTPFSDVTTYNNFYEFGTGKSQPAVNAHTLKTRPWSVVVDGEVAKPQTFDMDALLKMFPLEERIYRMRCVEAWSMVIPWLGFELRKLLERVEPTSKAKYVAFTSLHDPQQMPFQRYDILDWPYTEGLRLDEAMHPLTLMAVGLYGKMLPHQNGAPMRLVVPWKYGFKGIKSVVKISLTAEQPATSWNKAAAQEYGFYANVNPDVSHPRWSQAEERRIGDIFKRPTLMFNGYGEWVADLYKGMDLDKNF